MTDEEFDQYLDAAFDELDAKHEHLITEYGIGDHSDFVVDYAARSLIFSEHGRPVVEARIIPLATHDPAQGSLVWFWSDPEVAEAIRTQAAAVKVMHTITAADVFITDSLDCGEPMLWELAALACKGLNAKGVHRIPCDGRNAYVLIEHIQHCA